MTIIEGLRQKRRELESQIRFMKMERALLRALLLVMAVVVLAAIAGCAGTPYTEIGAGYNTTFFNEVRPWDNAGSPAFMAAVGTSWELDSGKTAKCQYMHFSQITAGPPFNDKAESSLDHVGCSVTFAWRRQ